MPRSPLHCVLLPFLLSPTCLPAQVVITELLAASQEGLRDGDGLPADWIELHNQGDTPASLAGWTLAVDEAEGWRLPDVVIAPRGFLVVFASGKDRRDPARPLHASFRLDRKRGDVRLLDADGVTVRSRLQYGRQHVDVSFGVAQPHETIELIGPGSSPRYRIPTTPLPEHWHTREFGDRDWAWATYGIGFDRKPTPTLAAFGTDVAAQLRGVGTVACLRWEFDAARTSAITAARLRIRCVGGFVAWLNGVEVARVNVPDKLAFDSKALTPIEGADPRLHHDIDVFARGGRLLATRNVLAVMSLTTGRNATEHLLTAELSGYVPGQPDPRAPGHFARPSPGFPNGPEPATVAAVPRLTPASAFHTDAVTVAVEPPPGASIRYTTDGSLPDEHAPEWSGPLVLPHGGRVRARAFAPTTVPGPATTVQHTRLAPAVAAHRSELPCIVVSTHGMPIATKDWVEAHVLVTSPPAGGTCTPTDPPDWSGHGAIKLRGSSTLNLAKRSYGLELRDETGGDRAAALAGLPAAAEWVLYAPHNYDQAHLRNALCYELARRMGLPAPRWRFCELFVDSDGGGVTADDYVGLYLLVERIAVGKDWLALDRLTHKHARPPEVTGGYIVKIDRPGHGDVGFTAGGQKLQFVEPSEREITDPQRAFLQTWFDRLGTVLADREFAHPERGYPAWLDVDSFIDYHFFHEYTKNPDAYTLSTYMHLPRGGKLRMGPVWDFDRAMRTNDDEYWVGRPARPTGWTQDNYFGWWGILFRDPEFRARYRARGRTWLASELASARVLQLVRDIAATIAQAEERDRARWPIITPGRWHDELAELEQWIAARTRWFAEELLEVPEFRSVTGGSAPPLTLAMRHGNDGGVLYYTLDGADPRLDDGRVSPHARPHSGDVVIERDLCVRARVLVDGHWSRLTEAFYQRQTPTLAITEIMYNPSGGHHEEFVEFVNFGTEAISLDGIEVDGPIRFHFRGGRVRSLAPGERVLIVYDETAFTERYDPTGLAIAGQFLGRFSNTDGTLVVRGAIGEPVARVTYVDDWFPETDGKGRSLQTRVTARTATTKDDWRASPEPGGSPGR